MKSFENENLISESDTKQIQLTTHRLRYHQDRSSNSNFISIMLDKISSIELTYTSNPLLLIIGIITIPLLVGIILIVMYYQSKTHAISIIPDGGQPIIFEIKGMKREAVEQFIFDIENAAMKLKLQTS